MIGTGQHDQCLVEAEEGGKLPDAKSRGLAVCFHQVPEVPEVVVEVEVNFVERWLRLPIIISEWTSKLMTAYGGATPVWNSGSFTRSRPSNLYLIHTIMAFPSKITSRYMALNHATSTPHSDSEAIALLPMLNVYIYIIFGLFPPFQPSLSHFSILRTLRVLSPSLLLTVRPRYIQRSSFTSKMSTNAPLAVVQPARVAKSTLQVIVLLPEMCGRR